MVVALLAVVILAYNPHIVTGPLNKAIQSISHYHENKGKGDGLPQVSIPSLKLPGRKDRHAEQPAAELINGSKPPAKKSVAPVYGAGAVAVQKAKGL